MKGSTDFEVYESVVIKPRETILPWDEDVHPTYDLIYQVRMRSCAVRAAKKKRSDNESRT